MLKTVSILIITFVKLSIDFKLIKCWFFVSFGTLLPECDEQERKKITLSNINRFFMIKEIGDNLVWVSMG